ncbi:hypothetical protein N7509_010407 [Penicillium cosmopolitanum]|uniref:NACHT domain-containing protein n=1 Tax=Penicillium cosmopolitanum TaxID=1131564 RepID=A0A9W9VR93_9EURO|nr:uncharacterized protein N7509_010407 [Penicillium cosmopolitanum]KAJ5387866.1 hypothetical protein N7509_010407 [Penicillium cosmopolitanum]
MLDRRDNIERHHTNTCQWILELDEYQSWRNQPCGLLWIKGKPGAGKSTLMRFLHDVLEEIQDGSQGSIRLDFFFSARGTDLQRTPLGMFRALLNQIFDRDATIRPQVREIYEQRCRQFGFASGEHKLEWPQPVLEEILASAILASASNQHITVFVDALDEAGAQSAQQIAVYFHRLVDRAAGKMLPLQVCISCRHYPITEIAQAIEIIVEDHNEEDIATYIKDTLLHTDVGGYDPSRKMKNLLAEELTQHSNRVFQWAHLMIPLIKQKMLEGESFKDIHHWIQEVPVGLEDVYMYILSNVITASNRHQSFLIFQWLCLAQRPLSTTEMRYALATKNVQFESSRSEYERIHSFVESDERMERRIKALTGGLAEIVSDGDWSGTIQVVHQSVNDFLRVKGLAFLYHRFNASTASTGMSGDIVLLKCQATLYRSCLLHFATICSNGAMVGFDSDSEESWDKLGEDYPFLGYATINLFNHAEKAAHSRGDLLQNEIYILQEIMAVWVQIYRYICGSRGLAIGTTVLHMAAAANLVDVMKSVLLLDVEIQDKEGNTPLHFAARVGNITAGKILHERGADRETKNHQGTTPLIEAASCGKLEFVKWLLDEGVEAETAGARGGALHAAAKEGHNLIVEILLGAGADPNAQADIQGNALQAAAYNGHSKTIKILLDAGADPNAQGEYGDALQSAVLGAENIEIIKLLLNFGVDPNAQAGPLGNALQNAAYMGNTEAVKVLLNAGADPNTQENSLGNALQNAAFNGHDEIIKILLKAGANHNAQGGKYGTALQVAAYMGNTEAVQILLHAGADPNAQGGEYDTALQNAAYMGHSKTIKILLNTGTDINVEGKYGTALQAAVTQKHVKAVKLLLEAGAKPTSHALWAARQGGESEIIKMLFDDEWFKSRCIARKC